MTKLYNGFKHLPAFWRFTVIFLMEFVFFFGANLFKYWYFFEQDIPWRKVWIETSVITMIWSALWQFSYLKAYVKKLRKPKRNISRLL